MKLSPIHPAARLSSSSTLWVAILLPVLNLWAARHGVEIPWEVIATGVGAYGAKEAASKLAGSLPSSR